MIRLLILAIIILFFIWLISNLFLKDKKELNRKITFSKSYLFLMLLIGLLFLFWVLPRLGVNPLFVIQKFLPILTYLKAIIPF